MQAIINGYTKTVSKDLSSDKHMYRIYVLFKSPGSTHVRREFIHYGPDRNTCLVAVVGQLKAEFPEYKISIDAMSLCSKMVRTKASALPQTDALHRMQIEYICTESKDNFTLTYKYNPSVDPTVWMHEYLKYNTFAGEYYRYLSKYPNLIFADVYDAIGPALDVQTCGC